ncbi:MAG: helix-turn-helix transcriptional regulator [Pseudomonadales bacterium]|nr:helix-turn-helix transcriptional regulator [Pseudomonadales bacterium]
MPRPTHRTYSRYTAEAMKLWAGLIRAARIERKMTTIEVAERAGISRGLLTRIEKGDLKCEVGAVLEVATIVGVKLFDADAHQLETHRRNVENKLVLLPKAVQKKKKEVDDEF